MNPYRGRGIGTSAKAGGRGRRAHAGGMSDIHAPIRHDVDCCFVGASTAAVAAAVRAAAAGRRVLVLAERPYLGEDITATFRLRLDPTDAPRTPLARALFGEDGSARPTPMAAKARLDEALLDAGVAFVYGCFAIGRLRAADGTTAGVVVASRGGLFAVRAAVVVDATWRAQVARLAGLAFAPWPAGDLAFERVVVGGAPRRAPDLAVVTDPEPVVVAGRNGTQAHPIHRYRLRVAMADGGPSSFAAAEVRAGALTFDPGMARACDQLFHLPPDPVAPGAGHLAAWDDAAPLDAFRTADQGLWILGPCADLSRAAAAELVRPATFLAAGERVGDALAEAALARPTPRTATWHHADVLPLGIGRLRTAQDRLRDAGTATIAVPTDRAPFLGRVEVLVMGGGTAGASAGIAAGRRGARTLVCEYQPALGGVGTVGMISNYYFGNRVGFTSEVDAGTRAMGPASQAPKAASSWNIEWKQRWYQFASDQAGTEVWHGAIGCGAVVEDGTVRGVLVAGPYGVGVVACDAVIDATGNADIAAAAGAECEPIGVEHLGLQGSGLGPRQPGYQYRNTDWTFIDDSDPLDTTQAMVVARRKFLDSFDLSTLADTRERRRIVGDLTLSPLDLLAKRTFPDTIVTAHSNFDTHGFTVHPLFTAKPMDKTPLDAHVPFRCLLPRGLRGIAVTGLGKSAHRDALPVIRMQPDVQNEGYAMGVAAAMAARASGDLRAIDIKAVQRHLVEIGVLGEEVPGHADPFPLAPAAIAAAAEGGLDDHLALATLFAHPEAALPGLRAAFAAERDAGKRLRQAQVLGLLGDATGAAILAEAIAAQDWDAGWNFRGMNQFGRSSSPLDDLIAALGATGDATHGPVVIAKIRALGVDADLSHCRAVAEAVERLPLPAAAPALAALLALPGMAGHHQHDLAAARAEVGPDPCDNATRNRCLRELHLARALHRVGDHDGVGGRILRAYAGDLRAHYARHAQAVLAEPGAGRGASAAPRASGGGAG